MPEPEFDPTTFAPTFTNPALGLLWYAGDDWTKVGLLAQAVHGAGVLCRALEETAERIREAVLPLLEVADA